MISRIGSEPIARWLVIGAFAALAPLALKCAPPRSDPRVAIRVTCEPGVCEWFTAHALDVWSEHGPEGGRLDVVVHASELAGIAAPYDILVPDIDAVARDEAARIRHARPGDDWFAEYHDFAEIAEHLRSLVELAPDRVSLHKIGGSIEGRPILALKIGAGDKTVLVNGTQHAREWIATAVTTCVADRLVREYDKDPRVKKFVDTTTLWVVPVVNPDGYEYSWAGNRYWRKNRRSRHGVDLNRNFSTAWGGVGSSKNERSETYHGTGPFSEPETTALRDLTLREGVDLHVDFHAYGQLILYPWGYTRKPSPDDGLFRAIGDRMATAMFVEHDTRYTLQASADLYLAAGTMTDWMYEEGKALSYTIELRPKGRNGFVLPPEQIRPTCDEGFAAVLALRGARD